MMYRVYCDDWLLYHSKLENLKIFSPSVVLELNKTGSFGFTIYPDHPYYSMIKKMKSIITVFQDDYLLFRGRALNDDVGWNNQKIISCEGDLAFLLDSVQRPHTFTGAVADYLAQVINTHNSQVEEEKRFTVGTVTVEGTVSVEVKEYANSLETLQKQLQTATGGYLRTRQANGVNYIDYLSEFNLLAPQKITFGKNLLDLNRSRKGEDIATALIPLGKDGLTIASVNNGLDYIQDADAVAQYGFIVKPVNFDSIEEASELLQKGQAYLADVVNLMETIELSAADMATVDSTVESFHIGTQVQVTSNPHGINQRFLVSRLSIDLLDPASNKLTLGKTTAAFSEAVNGISQGQGVILREVQKNAQAVSAAIYNVEQNLQASIQVAEQNIQTVVAENYYLKDQTEALVSSVSTELTQTKNSFDIQFTQFNANIESIANNTDAEFEEIKKYIRFIDGRILLGEVGNELELQIANDRISFLQDGAEVAYFSDRKLYVTDGEYTNSLKLGKFAFMPRANGNLSFKKVVD